MIDSGSPSRLPIVLSLLLATRAGAQTAEPPQPQPQPQPAPQSQSQSPPQSQSQSQSPPQSQSSPPPQQEALVAPRVDVIGGRRALDRIPGSAAVLGREDLRQLAPQNSADVLRTVTGLHIVPEDGMGLRLNLGVRGLDPNRSRKILILEDGMPVTLNPYGSPEAYYSPPIERMERVEVVKGSGQILWGPQTIGGVVNYITRDPPRRLSANTDLRYGSFNYLLAQAGAGATHGPIGWRVDVIHRRFDGPRRLDLAVTDVTGKLRLQFTPRSVLGLKLSFYDESSRATYVGLTEPQYALDPARNLAEHDRFLVRRYALSLTHKHLFSDKLLLNTGIYAYETERVWRRQEFDRRDLGVPYERACDPELRCGPPGDPGVRGTQDGGSIFFRRTTAIRDRAFLVAGIEPRLTWTWAAPRIVDGEVVALVRLHHERARVQIQVGAPPTAEAGDLRDDEQRVGYALAAALQGRFSFLRRLHITPGLRFEGFWSERVIARAATQLSGGEIVGRDVDIRGKAFSFAVIPGLGVSADVIGPLSLYAGAHRGYAPPRTQDAVSAAGQDLQLSPELSWNFEAGARLRKGRWLQAELAGFHLEFENQIIPPSEAGGAVSGGEYNTGHSRHTGLEASVNVDPLGQFTAMSLPLIVNYTYLPLAAFVGGLYGGNRLPYAPEHILSVQLRFAHPVGVSAQLGLTYLSAQFADKDNTLAPTPDGLIGEIPGYATLDARVAYQLRRAGLTFYVSGKNLTNQVYIASRAPMGIQPAGFLQVFGGIEGAWGSAR